MKRILSAVVLLTLSSAARADFVIDGIGYKPGASESLPVTFTTPTGGVTTGLYSGYVEIAVSGIGHSFGPALNDAFYRYTDLQGNPITPENVAGHYQLAFDTAPLPENAYDRAAINFIRYDVQAGLQVTPAYVPAYRGDHAYDVVVKLDSMTPSKLYLGVADGVFTDNGGAFAVTVTQLNAVLEPASLTMLGIGLIPVVYKFRRRR